VWADHLRNHYQVTKDNEMNLKIFRFKVRRNIVRGLIFVFLIKNYEKTNELTI